MPRRSAFDWARLAGVLQVQRGVISREQALACGVPRRSLDHWVAPGGRWQRLLPGVYLAVTGTATQDQREMGALLYAGPGSLITGAAALRRHLLHTTAPDVVDVLIPARLQRQSVQFVRISRTTRMPARTYRTGPIRIVGVARAAADAARELAAFDDVRAVVSEAVQRDACSVAELVAELNGGPTQRSALLRAALIEVSDGVRSVAEADFRSLLIRGRVPRPMFNAKLYTLDGTFIAMVDAWWDDAGVAAEVDSRAYHLSAAAQEEDRDRHDMLIAHGVFPLHFSPRRTKADGQRILSEIEAALEKGRQRPRLPIVALPADADWASYASRRAS
jgi:hypothetical protein